MGLIFYEDVYGCLLCFPSFGEATLFDNMFPTFIETIILRNLEDNLFLNYKNQKKHDAHFNLIFNRH